MVEAYEDPQSLLRRLKLGREEYCQRLLTVLILGGTYPRWNTRSTPTAEGAAFLRALDALSFGEARCTDPIVFVDELELAPRHADERGGAPDYGLLWPQRVWLIELKTEAASHRADQIPSYLRLGAHHYPAAAIDITYLTPPLGKPAPELQPGQRYAHLTWDQVVPLVEQTWGSATDPGVVRVRDGLLWALGQLALPVAQWRGSLVPPPVAPDEAVVELARLTAADGQQRAVELEIGDLQALHDRRVEVQRLLAADPSLDRVLPWLWSRATSGGRALTPGGAEHGYELRLSRYEKPVR